MRAKKLLFLATAVAASFSSCTNEDFGIPASEEYTRNFIKEFGLIDPSQDWNLAEGTNVTVKVGNTPAHVKAYMKVDNTYYLVADLENVSGTLKIPFDMPEGTQKIMVKIDSKRYYTAPGGTVDPANPGSRSVAVTDGESGASSTATYAKYTTTSTIGGKTVKVVASNTNNYAYFNALQMGPILSKGEWEDYYSVSKEEYVTNDKKAKGILPESDESGDKKKKIDNYNSSFVSGGIYDDFVFDASKDGLKRHFTMYPMYWQTSQPMTTLGVYMVDANDNKIHKFPIYTTKRKDGDIEMYYPDGVTNGNASGSASGEGTGNAQVVDVPAGFNGGNDTPVIATATEISYELFLNTTTSPNWTASIQGYSDAINFGSSPLINKDKLEQIVKNSLSTIDGFKAWYNEWNNHITVDGFTMPENSVIDSDLRYVLSSLTNSTLNEEGTIWTATANFKFQGDAAPANIKSRAGQYTIDKNLVETAKNSTNWGLPYWGTNSHCLYSIEEMLLRSRAVDITIEGYDGEFGMYIEFGNITLYSQGGLNDEKYAGGITYPNDAKGKEVYGDKAGTLANSYAATYLHPITKQLFFSFEDWTDSSSDGDLNDLVFMFSGVTKIVTPNNEIELDEVPDPDFDEEILEEPYNWLLAVEDLGATDDFDFNDIIIGINAVTVGVNGDLPEGTRKVGTPMTYATYNGESVVMYQKVTFKALAAGGTRKAYAFYGDELLYPDGSEGRAEWHAWFGNGGISSTTMINTGYGTDNQAGATCTIYFGAENGDYAFTLGAVEGSVDAKYDKRNDFTSKCKIGIDAVDRISADNISIDYFEQKTNDEGEAYFVKPADAGAAPQMFLIPDGTQWAWPKERSHISSCYSGFADWVKDGNGASDWYKNPSGDVIRY